MGIHMLQLPEKDDFRENHISNMWTVKTSVMLEEPAGYGREGKRRLWGWVFNHKGVKVHRL